MKISKEDIALIEKMIDDGCISRQKHPLASLYILNYNKKANFNKVWNRATKMCRGLIVDEDRNIVARPFEKFFNYEEIAVSDELGDKGKHGLHSRVCQVGGLPAKQRAS